MGDRYTIHIGTAERERTVRLEVLPSGEVRRVLPIEEREIVVGEDGPRVADSQQ